MAFALHMTGVLLSGQVNGCFLLQSKREPRLVTNTPFSLAINVYHIPTTIVNLWHPALAGQRHACPVSVDASRCFSLHIGAFCLRLAAHGSMQKQHPPLIPA